MTVVVSADVIAKKIGETSKPTESMRLTSPRKTRRAIGGTPIHPTPAVGSAQAIERSESQGAPPAQADPVLVTIRNLGRTLDDLERARIMGENRVRAARAEGFDSPWMEQIEAGLRAVEHEAELQLKRAWRKHPLAPWAKAIPGAGEVLMGRLIAEIGDPAARQNPGKLLAYCGHGDPARAGKIPKGATQEELFKRGSPHAKKAVWKLAYQFMRTVGTPAAITRTDAKDATPPETPASDIALPDSTLPAPARARSPYRDIYDERKAATEGRLHQSACVRCGPAGHPALPGSPWSDAHRHADALRIVGKEFLKDLWVAARAIQAPDAKLGSPDLATRQATNDIQSRNAGGTP